ncbi:MAG: hypothetical protein AAF492_33110 [Verrucomicrobiota bacterium]
MWKYIGIFSILAVAPVGADQLDLGGILEDGMAARCLPEGLVIRLEADLSGGGKKLKEIWEISADGLSRLERKDAKGKRIHRRVESVPFESKSICNALVDAQILQLAARMGEGGESLTGTGFKYGAYCIEFFLHGKSVFWVGESCFGPGFTEDDSRAFAALYNELAAMPRKQFRKKPAR